MDDMEYEVGVFGNLEVFLLIWVNRFLVCWSSVSSSSHLRSLSSSFMVSMYPRIGAL